jgi:hypothetical protein
MKINLDFINKIFNLEIKIINQKDKDKLSKYEDYIPMYDIYSQKIYPIDKKNIHHKLIEAHYRFINQEINEWINNLYNKNIDDPNLSKKYKYNLEIISNYNLDILIETSYRTLYKYSPELGLSVSICKRNSFNPYIHHLKPYYTKTELIKLGQNMNIIKTDIDPELLIDQDTHYSICKQVSKNDVSFDDIKNHHEHILKCKIESWVCFYSLTGSFLFNQYLRNLSVNSQRSNKLNNDYLISDNYYQGLYNIVKCMEQSPELSNDYDIYRFIWDDSFISNLSEGDIFIDRGFMSTTRDPFYSPGINGTFGLILLKINIPKNKKGCGLFIENFSLFPKEEEFLIPPYSKIKLISKNNNFKYYHTNQEFEKLINRKYEFELVEIGYKEFYENHKQKRQITEKTNKFYNLNEITLDGVDRFSIIKQFINQYSINKKINLNLNNKKYSFNYQWFDSSESSSYKKFYFNNTKDGILFSIFDENGYPWLNIELGNQLVINYLNQLYFGECNKEINEEIIEVIYYFGKIFHYKEALIFHRYTTFKFLLKDKNNIFTSFNLFNVTLYNYLKNGSQYLSFNPFITYNIGYWYLDEYFNKSTESNIIDNVKTNKDLFINTCETNFEYYQKMCSLLDSNIINKSYVTLNIYDKLQASGETNYFRPNIEYSEDNIIDDDFKLIFRQPIRRL